MKPHRRPHRKQPASGPSLLERLNPNAAGIDCGSAMHYVAVAPDRDATPVRAFTTFTTDLHRLADWLNPPGSTGFPSTRSWKRGASTWSSSTRVT